MKPSPTASTSDGVWGQATVPPSVLQPGMALGRYQVLELLGRGGMGEVWKAFDPNRNGPVVIKLLPLALQGNALELQRIQDSFRSVNALQHQHICPVYDLASDERVGDYLVMKFVEGETLAVYRFRVVRERGEFPVGELADVLGPVAAALDYAHGQGIIHRDVKPQNILVREDGTDPQLVDFGLAEEIRMATTRVSQAHVGVSGTYAYMAPEQWRGRPQDGRADQYALAVVAYELIVGHPPFQSPDPEILRMCVLGDEPPEIASIAPAANRMLHQALAKDPQDRFRSCQQFLDALAVALSQVPGSPPRKPAKDAAVTNQPSRKPQAGAMADPAPGGLLGWRQGMLFLGTAVVALLAGVVLFGWLGNGSQGSGDEKEDLSRSEDLLPTAQPPEPRPSEKENGGAPSVPPEPQGGPNSRTEPSSAGSGTISSSKGHGPDHGSRPGRPAG